MSRYTLPTGWGLIRLPHARKLQSEIDKALQEIRDDTDASDRSSGAEPSSAPASPTNQSSGNQSSSIRRQPLRDLEQHRSVRSALHDQALAKLRTAILSGRYHPGDDFTEIALAAELSVSRSTIRGVLRKLQQEGLVVTGARGVLQVPAGYVSATSDAKGAIANTKAEPVKRAEDVPDP